ncbi:MAG: LptF/LptG family permease [Bacteroides sp.]|nr:LptF/LptG family permease [Prevotella sp.]MCM1407958.1 LptF/LptG family permease [Treponema brennaborense]MCM1469700.1 LptF/LptG family permease [Bacteroides sp.]
MTFIKFLLKKIIPVFLGAVCFFSIILLLVDLLMNLWSYIALSVPASTVFTILLLYVPKTIFFGIPLSVLFASAYVLSDLYAKNELTVIFASGVSLFQFSVPLLLFSLLLSFGLFFFEDIVVVPTYAKKIQMQEIVQKKEKSLNSDKIVVMSDNGNNVYKADYYDDKNKRLYGLFIVYRNTDKSLKSVVRADSAYYRNDSWHFVNALLYICDGTEIIISYNNSDIYIDEPPETFRNNIESVETENTRRSKQYIAHLRRTGRPFAEQLSLYYKKYSFPFVVFIVAFLSIGLSGKTRKNVLMISLVLCLCSAVLFYVTQMITMLLAKFGYLSPLAGAWFPVILFVGISVVLLKFART